MDYFLQFSMFEVISFMFEFLFYSKFEQIIAKYVSYAYLKDFKKVIGFFIIRINGYKFFMCKGYINNWDWLEIAKF